MKTDEKTVIHGRKKGEEDEGRRVALSTQHIPSFRPTDPLKNLPVKEPNKGVIIVQEEEVEGSKLTLTVSC